ncbi:MAG: HD domain-containing protein [Candidatus Nanohaloarchaeota archaeon QJJ-7]|nr:HD domain-containing protein [Candidatus Nanohaloarchaeota archaeon QJJ-7]
MQVQDPIHGYIELNDVEEDVLDTPEMQRLRRVKQLGLSSLVYPSATHSRFEHSLGAFALASQFAESLGLGEKEAQELRLAGLLHDVGHGPFSHVSDRIFHENGTSHEQFSKEKVRDSRISDLLEEEGIDPEKICQLIGGEGRLGSVIAGHIDVDRMDYLVRDAHYTGVAYGTIDEETIIRAARLDEGLAFSAKYVNAIESLLTARYLMMPTVYMHRTSRIAEQMFLEAYRRFEEEQDMDPDEMAAMDDSQLMHLMKSVEASRRMVEKIEDRQLYKVAARLDPGRETDELREEVMDSTGLPREEVLVDSIEMDGSDPYEVPLVTREGPGSLDEVSPLPEALRRALEEMEEIRVYTPRENVDSVHL